jgi:RNA polymerase sigma-70 factor, ECF subfamily
MSEAKPIEQVTAMPRTAAGLSAGAKTPEIRTLEAELVERARGRDEAALREIMQTNNRRLYRLARGILRSDSEAEDVVQETYVRAFTHLDGFRGEAALSSWLTRITVNEANGRLRTRRPTAAVEALDLEPQNSARIIQFPLIKPAPDPEAEMSRTEIRDLLEHAVDTLPETFRAVFVMRDIEGMSIEETAGLLALKPETVKTRLHRARKLMREAIASELSGAVASLFPFDGMRCVHMADRVLADLRAGKSAEVSPSGP